MGGDRDEVLAEAMTFLFVLVHGELQGILDIQELGPRGSIGEEFPGFVDLFNKEYVNVLQFIDKAFQEVLGDLLGSF
jgi:hypothetical protein